MLYWHVLPFIDTEDQSYIQLLYELPKYVIYLSVLRVAKKALETVESRNWGDTAIAQTGPRDLYVQLRCLVDGITIMKESGHGFGKEIYMR